MKGLEDQLLGRVILTEKAVSLLYADQRDMWENGWVLVVQTFGTVFSPDGSTCINLIDSDE